MADDAEDYDDDDLTDDDDDDEGPEVGVTVEIVGLSLYTHHGVSAAERENGKAAWLLGASFISEGSIPFAAADPLRVIARSSPRTSRSCSTRRC